MVLLHDVGCMSQIVAEEARESYKKEIYVEFESNTADEVIRTRLNSQLLTVEWQMESNAQQIADWIQSWQPGKQWGA